MLNIANDKLHLVTYGDRNAVSYKCNLDGSNLIKYGDDRYIKSTSQLNYDVVKDEVFIPQENIHVYYNDGTSEIKSVTWDTSDFDTSIIEVKSYSGKVEGYDKEVILKLNIVEDKLLGNKDNEKIFEYKGSLYYTEVTDNNRLYKKDSDGNSVKVIDDSIYFVNIVDDWIYYCTAQDAPITKIKLDGTDKKIIYLDKSSNIQFYDEWIYFLSNGNIYKMDRDGNNLEVIMSLNDYNIKGMKIYGNSIYVYGDETYMEDGASKTKSKLVKSNMNGEEVSSSYLYLRVFDDMKIYGGYIYGYGYQLEIIDCNYNIIKSSYDMQDIYNISKDGILYYAPSSYSVVEGIYIKDLSSDKKELIISTRYTYANKIGEWIYYIYDNGSKREWRKVNLDGYWDSTLSEV